MTPLDIRSELPSDRDLVFAIHAAAFGRDAEAELVDVLRAAAQPCLSLVAESAGGVVGHVLFTPVTVESAVPAPACAGLAPVGVLPVHQGHGIGSALVRAGLAACAPVGWEAVFVLGAPAYYGRFGFSLAAPRGLRYESAEFDRAFQVQELRPDALAGCNGWVRYHEAFAARAGIANRRMG